MSTEQAQYIAKDKEARKRKGTGDAGKQRVFGVG